MGGGTLLQRVNRFPWYVYHVLKASQFSETWARVETPRCKSNFVWNSSFEHKSESVLYRTAKGWCASDFIGFIFPAWLSTLRVVLLTKRDVYRDTVIRCLDMQMNVFFFFFFSFSFFYTPLSLRVFSCFLGYRSIYIFLFSYTLNFVSCQLEMFRFRFSFS